MPAVFLTFLLAADMTSFQNPASPRFFCVVLLASAVMAAANLAQASNINANDGSVLLRMCKGAEKVKALSVMCHSYLNGYIDAAHFYSKDKVTFCLAGSDKEKAPGALVDWIGKHPDMLKQPAGAVLQKALTAHFPCNTKK